MSTSFQSWLAPHFECFVLAKRAGGADYASQALLLRYFDDFLVARECCSPFENETLFAYLKTLAALYQRGQDNRVSVVWQALAHASRHGAAIPALRERPRTAPAGSRLRCPFVLSRTDTEKLLAASLSHSKERACCGATHPTLLGLIYTTGLRRREALDLDVGDFDPSARLLKIRAGKFRKARDLPLPESTVNALSTYLSDPRRPVARGPQDPLFVSLRRNRLSGPAAVGVIKRAARLGKVRDVCGRLPCLHDLRHTFAVHRLAAWYQDGRDVNALLPALSGYMGHSRVDHTLTYLRDAQILLKAGAERFETLADACLGGGAK